MDGVFNPYLPGSLDDPLLRPNIPFATDVNRYSDGFTSSSYFDVTSSHFSKYTGKLANITERYERHRLYQESAAAQGVAVYGLGDARNEDAAYSIMQSASYDPLTNPQKTFPVYANVKWNPSDFAIHEGEYYNISVANFTSETQYWYDGNLKVTARGYESYYDAVSNCYIGMGSCRSYLKKRRRRPDINWMALVCAVGQYVRPLTETELGKEEEYRYLPLDESELIPTLFYVGEFIKFRAVHTGELICFANDAHTLYWNNQGYLNVTVSRVSWPPKQDFTYQDLYLPACDSAGVVYTNKGINGGKVKCNPNGGGSGWTESELLGL